MPVLDVSVSSCVLNVVVHRYFKVLIQEMDLRLDLGFLYAILDLFTAENAAIVTSEQEVIKRHTNTTRTS